MAQRLDPRDGSLLGGGRLSFIQAGTTSTPQNAFQDYGLTIPHPNPIILDAGGNIPPFYLEDGFIKVRLVAEDGVTILEVDQLLVVGPSDGSGGGGGGGVDPTTVFQTGDVMWAEVDSSRTGWVRDNGRTIGSSSSGATERANADTEALFNFLWQTFSDVICPVSGGRGGNSAADWTANKTIGTPDKRGYVVGGLPTMGNSDSGRFANVPVVSGSLTTAGSVIGEASHTLTQAQLPAVNFAVVIPSGQGLHSHGINGGSVIGTGFGTSSGPSSAAPIGSATLGINNAVLPAMSGTAASGGSGTAANVVQKTVLGTFFRKL